MKIALLSAFYPYRGGIAQFSAMLYRALEKEHEVHAYTFKRQYPSFLFPGTSQFVTMEDQADPIDAERILDTTNPLTFGKAARVINEGHPDLFISQYWMTFFGIPMARVQKRLKNVKRISILHNVIPHEKRFFDNWSNRTFLKYNDGFVVLSDAVLKDLLSLKPDAKYLRIDHPVYSQFGKKMPKDEACKSLGLSADKKYLLFFGFIRDYKGLDLLLNAMDILPHDYELIVAGEVYGSFEKYDQIIRRNGISERVHLFNSYISDADVSRYFSASDVCLLPYRGATQSGITAIAHHFNLPIIATDVGGLKENIAHGVTGLVVDKPDSELIALAVKRYFDENLMGVYSTAIELEKAENSWENFASRIVDFASTI